MKLTPRQGKDMTVAAMRQNKIVLHVSLVIFMVISQLTAKEYYVTQKETINNAIYKAQPGDVIIVKDGVYKETIDFDEKKSVTIKAAGNKVIITGVKNGMVIDNCSNIVVDGFKIQGVSGRGIFIVNSDSITIKNCEISNTGDLGILTGFCNYLLIENNEVHDTRESHGIYVSNSGDWPIVRNNYCHDNSDAGIQLNADKNMGGDGIITNALIENNVICGNNTDSPEAFALNLDGVQNSVIRNNFLCDNFGGSIVLFKIDAAEGSKSNLVSGNTVYYSQGQDFPNQVALSIVDGSAGCLIRGNVFATDGPSAIELAADIAGTVVSDNNIFYNSKTADNIVEVTDTKAMDGKSGYWRHYALENNVRGKIYDLNAWQKFSSQDKASNVVDEININAEKYISNWKKMRNK
ncbi:MAG: hypothetical protein A2252_11800 [Elusimicrobia bacterium RIFOXYA2_FULL_39_19]|nr:MAG: hypothetical protein A2252_11800 [Elusimicrobia bacterium RIFOXYA2_FULL_39_19]